MKDNAELLGKAKEPERMEKVKAEKEEYDRKKKEEKRELRREERKRPKKKKTVAASESEKDERKEPSPFDEEIHDLGARIIGLGDPQAWLEVLEEQANSVQEKGGCINLTSGATASFEEDPTKGGNKFPKLYLKEPTQATASVNAGDKHYTWEAKE